MGVALFTKLPLKVRVTLLIGTIGVLTGIVGAALATDLAWIKFFDNLHWTAGTVSAALVVWLQLLSAPLKNAVTQLWIAIGLSAYALGQIIWDIQIFAGYSGFPSPSDLFYLWLGPCIGVGLSLAVSRLAGRERRKTLALDALMLIIAALTLTLTFYLPERGSATPAQLAILAAYPVTLLAAACIGLIVIPSLTLRFSGSYGLLLFSVTVTGLCWMLWNHHVLNGERIDGLWFNGLFSLAVLGIGTAACAWDMQKSDDAHWQRHCDRLLRQLPLWTVIAASIVVVAAHFMQYAGEIAGIAGMLIIIVLAAVRQNMLLADYDLLRKTSRELEESRTLLDLIFAHSLDGIVLLDKDYNFIRVNESYARLCGRDAAEFPKHNHFQLYPSPLRDEFEAAIRNRSIYSTHSRSFIFPDHPEWGITYWDLSMVPIWGSDGVELLLFTLKDVTGHKCAEEALRLSETRLNFLIANSPGSIYSAKAEGDYGATFMSANIAVQLGYQPEDFTGDSDFWVTHLHPDDKAHVLEGLKHVFEDGTHAHEYRFRHRDGSYRWMHDALHLIRDADGKPRELIGYWMDITERKNAEQDLRIAATAFETQEGIIITDEHHIILRVNRAFTRITGYTAEEVVGNKPSMLKSGRHETDFYRNMRRSLQEKGYWQGEIWDRHKRGHIYPKWLVITAVKNARGETTHYVGSFSDITKRKADEEKIRTLAFYDTLTDLPNRRLMSERLSHAIAVSTRIERYGALLYLDIDNFKTLNDIQGHSIGDRLLVETGRRLLTCIREADTVSRLGGDEFVVLLENLASDAETATLEAKRVVEKIFAVLDAPFLLNGSDYCYSACVGIALFNGKDTPYEVVLSRADTALFEAKKSGKKTYRFFDPIMQTALEKRARLESALRQAINYKQFELFYQIQIDQLQRPIGAEALLRWRHPQRGLVSPDEFIAVAEATGMILDIGRWVLETACAQIKAWESQTYMSDLKVSVNVSIKQFYQQTFVDEVRDIVMRYAINPTRLKLELTESVILEDAEEAIIKMTQLKTLGIRLSMDDFGTGYSSLSCIKRLPFDQVKIDKSFVNGVNEDANDRFIVSTVVGMGKLLGISVIAEGVENTEQFTLLKELGCEFFQGHLFGKAEPVKAFEQRCAQWPIAAKEGGRLPGLMVHPSLRTIIHE